MAVARIVYLYYLILFIAYIILLGLDLFALIVKIRIWLDCLNTKS